VTLTATVSPGAPTSQSPTGTVTFSDGGTVLGSAALQLVNGQYQASLTTAALDVGSHTITAAYNGDGNFLPSTSAAADVEVAKATPALTWDRPADITYGTALGAVQFDATALVSGSFAYSATAGTVLHAGAGQLLSVTFTPDDTAHYNPATRTVVINVNQTPLVIAADDTSKVYGQANPALTFHSSGFVNGDTAAVLSGSPALTTSALQYSAPGIYAIIVGAGTLADPDYAFRFVNGALAINQAATGTALSASVLTPLAGVDPVTLTATVAVNAPGGGALTGTVDFYDLTAGRDLGSAAVVNGVASLTAGPFAAGRHVIAATYSGDSNFLSSAGTASLTALAPASVSGSVFADFNDDGQIDFGEAGISGVSVRLNGADDLGHAVDRTLRTDGDGAYLFLNLRPGNYSLTKATQPAGYTAGIDSVGTAGGSLSTTVADQFSVHLAQGVNGLNYNYGERPAATGPVRKGQAAGIGFWNNKNGQTLIKAFNGGAGHQLADWLAATLPHMFGIYAGSNLTGQSNASVAALFQQDFLQQGPKLDAQVLATALSAYATNATLDATKVAAQYGFTVSGDGVGTAAVSVGSDGDAFGVANNTTMTVMDLLLATDAQAVNGVLYNGNTTKRSHANDVYSAINQAGGL
jgi:hypothetical protein